MPARDRHADRGRAVRRDRRLRAVRRPALTSYIGLVPSESTTGESRRLGSITKTGSGHARRLLVEAAWHSRRPRRSARRSQSARTTSHPKRSRSPGQRNTGCTAPGHASKPARNGGRSSPSLPRANSPDSSGRSPDRVTTTRKRAPSSRRLGRWRPGSAGNPERAMSNPPAGWPRSILDSGSPRRTTVLRQLNREYQPDPRRAQHAGPPPTQPTTPPSHQPRKREIHDAPLDKPLSISALCRREVFGLGRWAVAPQLWRLSCGVGGCRLAPQRGLRPGYLRVVGPVNGAGDGVAGARLPCGGFRCVIGASLRPAACTT